MKQVIIQIDNKQEMVEALQVALTEGEIFAAQCRKILILEWGATPDTIDQQKLIESGTSYLIDCCVKGVNPIPYKKWVSDSLSELSNIGLAKMGLTRDQYAGVAPKDEYWLDKITTNFYDKYCRNCGDSSHVKIDGRLRCTVCGEDNGTLESDCPTGERMNDG